MTKESRDQFSETLGHQPVLIDCTAFSKCRRPRLFWVDWPITARGQEEMVEHDTYREWKFPDLCTDPNWWLDNGCSHSSNMPLPTFTRALPRSTPPRQPAGVQTASSDAIQRWSADNYRFQVVPVRSLAFGEEARWCAEGAFSDGTGKTDGVSGPDMSPKD